MWLASLQTEQKPLQIVVRGKNEPVAWSPDGQRLPLFASHRGDHSFIGIYDPAAPYVKFLAPTVDSDTDPVWSTDGKQVGLRPSPWAATRHTRRLFHRPRPPTSLGDLASPIPTPPKPMKFGTVPPPPESSYPARAREAIGVLHFAAERSSGLPQRTGWLATSVFPSHRRRHTSTSNSR